MKVPDQDDLAWDLFDAVRTDLDIPTINRVSMTMADGDYPAVIELLLESSVRGKASVSDQMGARLEEWVHFYAAHPSSPRLRQLLGEIMQ